MKVSVGALLGVRRLLGWHNLGMVFPEGVTIADWLKAIQVPGQESAFELMITENVEVNKKYMIMYNKVRIGAEMLNTPIKEGDRLVLLDYMYLPTMFVA